MSQLFQKKQEESGVPPPPDMPSQTIAQSKLAMVPFKPPWFDATSVGEGAHQNPTIDDLKDIERGMEKKDKEFGPNDAVRYKNIHDKALRTRKLVV